MAEGLHERLLAATSPLAVAEERTPEELAVTLRAVVKLHAPQDTFPGGTTRIGYAACCGCDVEGGEWEHPEWPCSTIHTIADQLGLTEGTARA